MQWSRSAKVLADLLVEASSTDGEVSREDALRWLLHSKEGSALIARLAQAGKHQTKGTPMDATLKIAKGIAETGESWLTEAELTEKIFAFAQHDRRAGETPEQAFARHFTGSNEQGQIFRKAVQVAKTGSLHPFPR